MLGAIIWLITMIALWCVGVLSAVVVLGSKDRTRQVGLNVLLCTLTLIIACAMVGRSNLFQDTSNKAPEISDKSREIPPAVRLYQATLAAKPLKQAEYLTAFDNAVEPFMLYEWGMNEKEALAKADASLKTLVASYPTDPAIASRLAILRHRQGADPLEVLDKYSESGGRSDRLLLALYSLYATPFGGNIQTNIKDIDSGLPSGWYRDEVLLTAYKAEGGPRYQAALTLRRKQAQDWCNRLLLVEIVKFVLAIAGVLVIIRYLRSSGAAHPFVPITQDFKKAYGCLLIVPFISSMWMVVVDFTAGLQSSLKIEPTLLPGVGGIPSIICGLFGFYYLACKPSGLTLWQAVSKRREDITDKSIFMIVAGGICAILTLETLGHFISTAISGNQGSLSNSAQFVLANQLFAMPRAKLIGWVASTLSTVPLMDALFFRGLIYGWMRFRFGILVATLVSALAFAGWHFNQAYFAEYFAVGLILAAVYERTNSLLVTIAVHALWCASLIWIVFFLFGG